MLRFNFAEIRESAFEKYVKPDLLFLIVIVLTALVVELLMERSIKSEISRVNQEITKLEAEKRKLRRIQREEKKVIAKRRELEEKLRIVSKLDKSRKVPAPLYFFASKENMRGIWLNQLKISDRKVSINGNIWKVENFPYFLNSLEEKIGKVLFRQTRRVSYENKKLNLKLHFYNFELEAERR